MKKLIIAVVSVLCLLAALFLASPWWAGPAVKSVANAKVPEMAGVAFSLSNCDIGTFSGKCLLEGLEMGNPDGFPEGPALKFDSLKIDLDLASLKTRTVHIREIALDGLFVSYVHGPDGVDNFTAIGNNFSKGEAKADGEEDIREEESAGDKESQVKVVIDMLRIKGAKIKVDVLPLAIPVPTITLRDIGKEGDGVDISNICKVVSDELLKACGIVGGSLGSAGAVTLDLGSSGVEIGTNTIRKAADALKTISAGGAENVSEGVNELMKLFKGKKK
jgi:hypothetical protein